MLEGKKSEVDYQFGASYEYDGGENAKDIVKAVSENFLFPCWAQRYSAQSNDPQEMCYLNMLDSRSFKKNLQNNQLALVRDDQKELEEMRMIFKCKIDYQNGNQEAKNYGKQAGELTKKWDCFQQWLKLKKDDPDSSPSFWKQGANPEDSALTVNIFQRILAKNKEDILIDEYFLIRFGKSELGVKQKNDKTPRIHTYSEQNTVLMIVPSHNGYEAKDLAQSTIKIMMKFTEDQPLDQEMILRYNKRFENSNVKVLKIEIELQDNDKFFADKLKVKYDEKTHKLSCFKNDKYYWMEPVSSRNRIIYPFQECKFQRSRIFLSKHFHLAFQGGGAKGLAYVGAYKSIREQRCQNLYLCDKKETYIPIKSIMGSSAGGIIALAISTGIPEYELQKICYKMNAIPKTDRFTETNVDAEYEAKDDYDTKIQKKVVLDNLCRLLNDRGIIQTEKLDYLSQQIMGLPAIKELQDKALDFLAAANPAAADMLTNYYEETVRKEGKANYLWSWIGKDDKVTVTKKKFNMEGLLVYGALMKGEAIHQIAQDCVVKFLVKRKSEKDKKEFEEYLRCSLEVETLREKQIKSPAVSSIIQSRLNQYFTVNMGLLDMQLGMLAQAFKDNQEIFLQFIIGLVNRFMVLIDNYKTLGKGSGLILNKGQINLQPLSLKNKDQGLINFFMEEYKDQKMQKLKKQIEIKNITNEEQIKIMQKDVARMCQKIIIPDESKIEVSYSYLNGLLNNINLISYNKKNHDTNFFKNFTNSTQTIFQFVVSIFKEQLKGLDFLKALQSAKEGRFKEQGRSIDQIFYAIQCAETFYELYTIFKQENPTVFEAIPQKVMKGINDYEKNINALKQQMKRITMQQYYRLTQIELSCTSVDLNNKILRFFNHKTTPLLPVCKSVQMTGSFPVGFKAQKWKKQWGKYHVHLLQERMEIDITGHEFTDGGLLANFPIKYMDNQEIRKRYFTNKSVEGETILLGFGLDYLDPSRYQMTQKQIQDTLQLSKRQEIGSKSMVASLKSLSGGNLLRKMISGFHSFSNKQQDVQWSQMSHSLINEIPLLRFIIKIMDAYPNADRNLNLEAFDNKVMTQQMNSSWMSSESFVEQQGAIGRSSIIEFVEQFHLHIKTLYDGPNRPNLNVDQEELKSIKQNVNKEMRGRKQKIIKKMEIMKGSYQKMVQEQGIDILNLKEDESGMNTLNQRELSLRLIKIFYLHLKMPVNRSYANRYSRFYAFMKFIAEDFQYRRNNQNQVIRTSKDQNITPVLNRINAQSLFDEANYQQISRHLGLYDYHTSYWNGFASKISSYPGSNKEYDKLEEDDYVQYHRNNKTKLVQNVAHQKDSLFYEMEFFDVTQSLRRVTQLIYLMIRGRNQENKLYQAEEFRELAKIIKTNNFEELLFDQNQEVRPKVFKANQKGKIVKEELKFSQIVDFLVNQMKEWKQISKNKDQEFQITQGFKEYLDMYSPSQRNLKKPDEKQKQEEKIFTLYIDNLISNKDSKLVKLNDHKGQKYGDKIQIHAGDRVDMSEIKIKAAEGDSVYKVKIGQSFKATLFDEYYYLVNSDNFEVLKGVMKKSMLASLKKPDQKQYVIKFVFNLLFKGQMAHPDEKYMEKLEQFLIFLFDDQFQFPKQIELTTDKEQHLKRLKRNCIEFLYFQQLFAYNYNVNESSVNFMTGIKKRDEFLFEIYQLSKQKFSTAKLQEGVNASFGIWKQKKGNKNKLQQTKSWRINDNTLKLMELNAVKIYMENKLTTRETGNQNEPDLMTQWQKEKEDEKYKQKWQNKKGQEEQQFEYLANKNTMYSKDMSDLFLMCKEMILLIVSLDEKQLMNVVDPIQPENIGKEVTKALSVKWSLVNTIGKIYRDVFETFVSKYYPISELPLNKIGESTLNEPFIIDYEPIKKLNCHFWPLLTRLYQHLESTNKLEGASMSKNILVQMNRMQGKMNYKPKSLPLFDTDRILSTQSQNTHFQRKVVNMMLLQQFSKLDNFSSSLLEESSNKQVQRGNQQQVHLVLEGVEHSYQYFGGLYNSINDILTKALGVSQAKNGGNVQQKIKMVTSSNFHSIFGFLLSMGYSIEYIRKELIIIQSTTNIMQNPYEIEQYFDNKIWLYNTPHTQKKMVQYLDNEHINLFDRIQTLKTNNYENICLKTSFKDMRMLYNHEKQELMRTYMNIIDETANSIEVINDEVIFTQQPLEISKKFGLDYRSKLDYKYAYSGKVEESLDDFKDIAQKLFPIFGDLLYGIICNNLVQSSIFRINTKNAKVVAKGILINRLLTTFKLKEYITSKLKENKFSPSISLAEYHEVARRRMFLNFTVIDVNKERLAFLNKNSMPNMPLWAAIIASSSLPFYHKFFEANKEWQATNSESFYNFFLLDFFRATSEGNSRVTRYTSANLVSSLPLELLTNGTLKKEIFKKSEEDQRYSELKIFALCFNPSYSFQKILDLKIHKKYFNLTFPSVLNIIKKQLCSSTNIGKGMEANNLFAPSYPLMQYFGDWFASTNLSTTINILSNSNDNFILRFYFDKLIRLPIKINTLEFNAIVDMETLKKYRVNVLTQKARETVKRSYQISNSFIYQISQRLASIGHEEKQIQSDDRFKVKVRAEIIQKVHEKTGFKKLKFKLFFLNHSQWNRNFYNNFTVQYFINKKSQIHDVKNKTYQKMNESEILWSVQNNTKIYLKFSYILKEETKLPIAIIGQRECEDKSMVSSKKKNINFQIRETEFKMDLKGLIDELPLRNSYDYEFIFGWQEGTAASKVKLIPKCSNSLSAIKRNGNEMKEEDGANLYLQLIEPSEEDCFNKKLILESSKLL